MDSSKRAVEAYWRSRMVDGVTSGEDKVAPVYKLEEICNLLRTSHVSIVKEISDYILKRLDHKSPVVKQKALRLIKYAVGKSGTEFRREMQRHSAVMHQLFHYKGQPDPLKGDALNKSVRDTAHEAVSAIFANDDNKPTTSTEGVQKRIQGFGNTNYETPMEEKKSFLSEVVGIGLSTISAANSIRKSDNGSYRSPNLQRSLTTEIGGRDRYEGDDYDNEDRSSSGYSGNMALGTWGKDLRTTKASTTSNDDTASSHRGIKSREERLLETIVTSGGVRLQPTHDAIQVFLSEALKLDPVGMSHALEVKLQSPLWQVRMKACCVLESILWKKDVQHFCIMASYFAENRDSVVTCSELPQASLREKANKVLVLLEGDQKGTGNHTEPAIVKSMPVPAVEMPDLIDTGDADSYGTESSRQKNFDQNIGNLTSSGSLVDDLYGNSPVADPGNSENRSEVDPFADVSFHVTEEKQNDDIFSGLTIDDKISDHELKVGKESGLVELFSSNSDLLQEMEANRRNVHDMMAALSLNGTAQEKQHSGTSGVSFVGTSFLDGINQAGQMPMNQYLQMPINQSSQMLINQSSQMPTNGGLNGSIGSNSFFPMAPLQYNMAPTLMFNPGFSNQPTNYAGLGAFIVQQQLLFQNLGNLNSSYGQPVGNFMAGAQSSPLPDIFQFSNNPVQNHATIVTSSNNEDTKAFDFISDHFLATRDSKRA